jgi:sphingomyelin phosphodiesterase acid-like 3
MRICRRSVVLALFAVTFAASFSQAEKQSTIPALFVSDIHFDPFHDPDRAKDLVAAPATEWTKILAAPDSPNQPTAFKSLQDTCHARGVDTPYALFASSLKAMHDRQRDAKFMIVSGDLIAHAFTCRYATVFPNAAPGDYQAFVVKTIDFVVSRLRSTFPGMPVYVALGNNDSGCGDYKLDANSTFFAQIAPFISEALPAAQRKQAAEEFKPGGYYSVTMAEPMRGTRLIALNDNLISPKYTTCAGQPDPAPAASEIDWLQRQLAAARAAHQKVWVFGHIPPGIDPYSTVAKGRNVCAGKSPSEFLSSDDMANTLADSADIIRLGIFGHTHMDEMRLFGRDADAASKQVPIKVVSSISPVDGNIPSFTVARIDPAAAVLTDYDVVEASNQTGIDATWKTEYNYAATFKQTDFAPAALHHLIADFKADPKAANPASVAYIQNYFVGEMSRELNPFWPEYVCALDNYTAKDFAACVCTAAK